ncbi:S24 family peptidase [uncultured Rikenella sp.]|uniref:S24 family peptidase n=1 Tax=uncultured Rikenella sp. TaxID=368003 RepID=UPI002618B703|nr:S24 family peptidase [uncultured Rikenella sp.]
MKKKVEKKISPPKERLLQYLEYKGINKNKFYIQTGVSNGTLDKSSGLTLETVEKFYSIYPDINIVWLLTGQGEMLKSDVPASMIVPEPVSVQIEPPAENHTAVPVVDIEAAAGFGAPNAEHIDKSQMIYLPKGILRGKVERLCIKVVGDSMAPTLYNNSRVVVRRLHESEWEHVRSREIYVVTNREGSTFIKRIENKLHQDGTLTLLSDNADQQLYKPISLPEEEIFAIWAVDLFLVRTLGEPSDPIGLANEMQAMKKQISDLSATVGQLVQKVNKES